MKTRLLILVLFLTASVWSCQPNTSQEAAEDASQEVYQEDKQSTDQAPEVEPDSSNQGYMDDPIIEDEEGMD